jgi:hypothetical protein
MKRLLVALGLAAVAWPGAAQSPQVLAAIGAGQVGERYDGYLGFASQPADDLRRQVIAINIQRRNLYTGLAAERGVTVSLVGMTTACTLLHQLPVGAAYMLDDRVWRRRTAGEAVPNPANCH